jgi:hypothetical protein
MLWLMLLMLLILAVQPRETPVTQQSWLESKCDWINISVTLCEIPRIDSPV